MTLCFFLNSCSRYNLCSFLRRWADKFYWASWRICRRFSGALDLSHFPLFFMQNPGSFIFCSFIFCLKIGLLHPMLPSLLTSYKHFSVTLSFGKVMFGNLKCFGTLLIMQTRMFVRGVRELENLKETHADIERTCQVDCVQD